MKEFSLTRFFYFFSVAILFIILVREYTYVHPYNPGYGLFGPKWKYTSTMTFTWWFLLVSSFLLIFPLFRKRKHGYLGLALFILVAIRPLVQDKFPEETAQDYYLERKERLEKIVKSISPEDKEYSTDLINQLGFDELVVKDSIYFFFCCEGYEYGLCYKEGKELSSNLKGFGKKLKITPIDKNWYEVDY